MLYILIKEDVHSYLATIIITKYLGIQPSYSLFDLLIWGIIRNVNKLICYNSLYLHY